MSIPQVYECDVDLKEIRCDAEIEQIFTVFYYQTSLCKVRKWREDMKERSKQAVKHTNADYSFVLSANVCDSSCIDGWRISLAHHQDGFLNIRKRTTSLCHVFCMIQKWKYIYSMVRMSSSVLAFTASGINASVDISLQRNIVSVSILRLYTSMHVSWWCAGFSAVHCFRLFEAIIFRFTCC
jgi:hypothetical protein